jgi:hypothetical protein
MNFFRTGLKILKRNRAAHLYLAGVSECEAAPYLGEGPCDRFHCLGPVEEPAIYQAAADVYLEGFPYGSQTALLESALAGAPAVAAYDPPCQLLVTQDDPIDDVLVTPRDEQEYIDRASQLIENGSLRREMGDEFRRRLLAAHTGEGWLARLNAIYAELDSKTHRPAAIGATACHATRTDLAIAAWQEARRINSGEPGGDDAAVQSLLDGAFRLRQRRRHADAWRLVRGAAATRANSSVIRAGVKLPMHWLKSKLTRRAELNGAVA